MTDQAPVPQPTVPAGWYTSTTHANSQQYWDGTAWTENYAPLAAPAQATPTVIVQQRRSSLATLIRILIFVFIFVPLIIFVFITLIPHH